MCASTAPVAADETPAEVPPSVDVNQAGTIGISGVMCRNIRWLLTSWILLSQDVETGKINVDPQEFSMDELLSSLGPELQEIGQVFQELELGGAEFVSINGTPCRGAPLDQVQELLLYLEGDFSMVFSKPDGFEWTKRVVILKPLAARDEVLDSAGSSNFWTDLVCTMELSEPDPLADYAQNHTDGERLSSLEGSEKGIPGKELCLGPISASHPQWMQQMPVAGGDRILDVNHNTFVQQLHPEDAQLTISTLYHCSPAYLSLLVRTPASRRGPTGASWRTHLRKGAAAVGGSVMVGAGAVLMVTPLHPLGHAMALAGVGVLGREFEAPRRAAKRASTGISNMTSNVRRSFQARRERRVAVRANTDLSAPSSSFGTGEDTSSQTLSNSGVLPEMTDNIEMCCHQPLGMEPTLVPSCSASE